MKTVSNCVEDILISQPYLEEALSRHSILADQGIVSASCPEEDQEQMRGHDKNETRYSEFG